MFIQEYDFSLLIMKFRSNLLTNMTELLVMKMRPNNRECFISLSKLAYFL